MFMKYIISEQRFERLVIRYLSTLGLREGNHDADGFDIMNNDIHTMAYRGRYKRLYVSIDLIADMKSFFDLSQKEVLNYVKKWFENEYEIEVNTLWFLFPDDPFTY